MISDFEQNILSTFIKVDIKEENVPKVMETLTRIGILNRKTNELYQSVHLFSKLGEHYLVHFKEMFILNGMNNNFSESDKKRRDKVANLLELWNLVEIKNPEVLDNIISEKIDIISFKEKNNYQLKKKYSFDKKQSEYFKNTIIPLIKESEV